MPRATVVTYWALSGLSLLSLIAIGVNAEGTFERRLARVGLFVFGPAATIAAIVSIFK
jgi:hypothetical protein